MCTKGLGEIASINNICIYRDRRKTTVKDIIIMVT